MKDQITIGANKRKKIIIWAMCIILAISALIGVSMQNIHALSWENIPSSAGLPSGKYINLSKDTVDSITWGTGFSHKKVYDSKEERYELMVKLKNGTSKASVYSGTVVTMKWKKATKIGNKYVDVTLKVKDLEFSKAFNTTNMRSDNYVTFCYLTPYTVWLHAPVDSKGEYRAARNCDIETTVTWSGTNDVVDLPFYMGVNDIDKGYGLGWYKEGWKAVKGFDSPWYYWKNSRNYKIDGTKVVDNSTRDCDDTEASWKRGGLIAPTDKGKFTTRWYGGACGTGYYLFNQYKTIGSPTKTVNDKKVQKGQTITWTITQEVNKYYSNGFSYYSKLVLYDKLPSSLEYVSAYAVDTKGNKITSGISYNSSTHTVSYSFPSSKLDDPDFYNGKSVKLVSKTKVTASSGQITNTGWTNFGDSIAEFKSASSTEVVKPALTISKKANVDSCEYRDTVKFTVKVTQTTNGINGNNVVVTDSLPTGMTIKSKPTISGADGTATIASDGKSWKVTIPKMEPDTPATITFNATVNTSANSSLTTLKNTATATCTNLAEPVSASDSVKVVYPSLSITKEAGGIEYVNKDVAEFTVKVKASNAKAKNVIISDTMPEGLTITQKPALTGATGSVSYSDTKWEATIPTLEKGKTAKITFKAKIDTLAASLTNTATTSAEVISSKSASATINVVALPVEVTQLEVIKKWSDNNNNKGIRPDSVTMTLYQNSTKYKTAELSEDNGWQYMFVNLPEYDANGTAYAYTVEEESVENYTSSRVSDTSNGYISWTYTNTIVPQIDINIKKEWKDNDNIDNSRPGGVDVQLLRNGTVIETVTLNKENNWNYTFKDQPKNDTNGTAYVYTTIEPEVPDLYEATYSSSDNVNGKLLTITNKYIGKVTVKGQKIWDDNNDIYGKRPTSITVNLLRDGSVLKTATVSADTEWLYEFTDLPKYSSAGVAYKYTVEEAKVPGYSVMYDFLFDEVEEME